MEIFKILLSDTWVIDIDTKHNSDEVHQRNTPKIQTLVNESDVGVLLNHLIIGTPFRNFSHENSLDVKNLMRAEYIGGYQNLTEAPSNKIEGHQ